jgi:hypothetical protein
MLERHHLHLANHSPHWYWRRLRDIMLQYHLCLQFSFQLLGGQTQLLCKFYLRSQRDFVSLAYILCERDHPLRWPRTRRLLARHRNLVHNRYGSRDSTDDFCGYSYHGVGIPYLRCVLQCQPL